jgi:hypothetical protein
MATSNQLRIALIIYVFMWSWGESEACWRNRIEERQAEDSTESVAQTGVFWTDGVNERHMDAHAAFLGGGKARTRQLIEVAVNCAKSSSLKRTLLGYEETSFRATSGKLRKRARQSRARGNQKRIGKHEIQKN